MKLRGHKKEQSNVFEHLTRLEDIGNKGDNHAENAFLEDNFELTEDNEDYLGEYKSRHGFLSKLLSVLIIILAGAAVYRLVVLIRLIL